jgi:hypothetical protein
MCARIFLDAESRLMRRPPGKHFLQQQAKCNRFLRDSTEERLLQALNMRYPAELYTPWPRPHIG